MADDSEYIKEILDFHPGNTPRGMLYYKLSELTNEQQSRLNSHTVNIIRSNQIYLQDHPEVKIIVSHLLKGVLRARPKYHVHKFLVKYLMETWPELKKKVEEKTAEREKTLALQRQREATLAYLKELYEQEEFEEADEFGEKHVNDMLNSKANIEKMCRSILDEIICTMEVKERHRVHINLGSRPSDSDIQIVVSDANAFDDDED